MKTIHIQKLFNTVKRKNHAIIVPIDDENKCIAIARKDVYPEGVYRFIGGGIDEGESGLEGAKRELKEEAGVDADLKYVTTIELKVTDEIGQEVIFMTHVYKFFINRGVCLEPADDISEIIWLSEKQLMENVADMIAIPHNAWYEGKHGQMSWGDWGKVNGYIHLQIIKALI